MAAFIAWCVEVGYEEDVDAVMRGDVIDRYLQQALTGFPDSSRATIRADLRRVASKVGLSPEAPVTPLHVEKWDIKAPYAADEVRAILHRIDLVVDPRTKARLQTTVALGLGAGLDTRDIRELNRSHITDHGDDGIEIAVPGDRPRTVWLRSEFEAMLRTGIAKLTRNEHVLGRTNMHKDAVRDLLATIQPIGAGPRVQQGRLRNTWLATLMTEPVSLWIILQAAGLAGARSLTEIAAFLEPVTDTTVVRGAA